LKKRWETVKLGTVASFRNGINFTKENHGEGIKIIGVSDFQDNFYPNYCNLEEINPSGIVKRDDYLLNNDILFVRSNGNRNLIGRSIFIKDLTEKITFSGFTIRLRFNSINLIPKFYFYLFRSNLIRQLLSAYGSGTNINNINQKILSELNVPLPSIETQRKIASILSAYDDLIENNTRRIKILEEMAQLIYKEWFVKFRFPGHEKCKFVDSELGKIPEGWNVNKVVEILDFVKGRKSKTLFDRPTENSVPYLLIDGIRNDNHVYTEDEKGIEAKQEDIIMIMDGASSGQVHIGSSGFLGSTLAKVVIKGEQLSAFYIYYYFLDNVKSISDNNTGSAIPHASKDYIKNMLIIIPSENLMTEFNSFILDIQSKIKINKNKLLHQTRDMLLPKLISGELDVEEMKNN
jgi:type I restriction enzyme, S subunit